MVEANTTFPKCCASREIQRIEQAIRRLGERFGEVVYSPQEWTTYQGQYARLSECFAGKEAVAKALGIGFNYLSIQGVAPTDIEILPDVGGRFVLTLFGQALERAHQMRLTHWEVSLSHTKTSAMALVIATPDTDATATPSSLGA